MTLVCFGSPMVDIIANVGDDFLDKYNLETSNINNQIIFEELQHLETQKIIGGSITNTVRVFSWISQETNRVAFIGAIGSDEGGKNIEQKLLSEGVKCIFTPTEKATDTCAVLINKESRTLVTHLSASFEFNYSTFNKREVQEALQESSFIYFSALFLKISLEIIDDILKFSERKEIIFNLGAPFIIEQYFIKIFEVMRNARIIFGNEGEWNTLYKHLLLEKVDCDKIKLLGVVDKIHGCKKILVMTRGSNSVLVFYNNEVQEYPAVFCEKLIDTNGAGDAFVGGFLAAYLSNQDVKCCIDCGLWAASEVVQNVGCGFDRNKKYVFK